MVGKMSDIHVYHWSARLVHWLSALTVVCLFALGLWMVGLDYYSPWYQTAPNWHRSIGILLAIFTCLRLLLYVLPRPTAIASHSALERRLAACVKMLLLLLMFSLFLSGYFISTAAGDPIYVFDWFTVPAILEFEKLEELAGDVHFYLAWSVIVLASLHGVAALKHHFIDKDITLKRMTFNPDN